MRKLLIVCVLLTLLSVPLSALAQDNTSTIADIVAADEDFSTLLGAVQAAGLAETLAGDGEFTVFAPTNTAFEALPPGMLDGLLSSPPSIEAVLKYHVVDGLYTAEDLAATDSVATLLGAPLSIVTMDDGTLLINGTARIVTSDIQASNGIIHVIDEVLVPERPGSTAPDADSGDASTDTADTEVAEPTLADTIAATEDLAFLNTAIGLSEVAAINLSVEGDTDITLFAPNDEAFTALDDATRNAAIADPKLLTSILLYHMVSDDVEIEDITDALETADTLEIETALPGASLTFSLDEDGNLLVNEAQVVESDLEAANGMLNIIDGVLTPPDEALLTQEAYDALVATARETASQLAADAADENAGDSEDMPEGPALDPNWDAVAGGFKMTELDTADDFFVTVIDPFAEGDDKDLYGIEIINWTADYKYTGYIVEQFLPAEVLLWMAEQDPTIWEDISDSVLQKLPAEELAKLPAEVQARVQ